MASWEGNKFERSVIVPFGSVHPSYSAFTAAEISNYDLISV